MWLPSTLKAPAYTDVASCVRTTKRQARLGADAVSPNATTTDPAQANRAPCNRRHYHTATTLPVIARPTSYDGICFWNGANKAEQSNQSKCEVFHGFLSRCPANGRTQSYADTERFATRAGLRLRGALAFRSGVALSRHEPVTKQRHRFRVFDGDEL